MELLRILSVSQTGPYVPDHRSRPAANLSDASPCGNSP